MKSPMQEALDKRHEKTIHIKISVDAGKEKEQIKDLANDDAHKPEVEGEGMEKHIVGDMRSVDKELLMDKEPKGLHEKVMREVLKKGKEKA